ncbi:MAG: hypothetical protein KIT36_23380 [Alphaproteobacteria bacterium]|nr:hypothetical protein [Alphaproteobacteria bacterium]
MLGIVARSAGLYGLAMAAVVARRTAALACTYLVIVLMTLTGLGFTTAAAWMALSDGLGRVYATLIVGCAHLVGALIVLLFAQSRRRW